MAGGDGDGSPFQYGRVEDGMVEPDSLTVADCTAEVARSVTNWEALSQVGATANKSTTFNKSEIGSRINNVALNENNFCGWWWPVGTLES